MYIRFVCQKSVFAVAFFVVIERNKQVCSDALQRQGDDSVPRFWRGFALSMEGCAVLKQIQCTEQLFCFIVGSYMEAIRELDPLQSKPDLSLAVTAALINTHKMCQVKGMGKKCCADCGRDVH